MSFAIALALAPVAAGVSSEVQAVPTDLADEPTTEHPAKGLVDSVLEHRESTDGGTSFAHAVELGKVAGHHNAEALGLELTPASLTPQHDAPSEAVLTLAHRYAVDLSDEQLADIHALDELDPSTHDALTQVVEAFLAFDAAAETAYEDDGPISSHADVFETRNRLLDAVRALHTAAQATDAPAATQSSADCEPVFLPPAAVFDLEGCDNTYTQDMFLSVDLGGNDTYHNNAGGAGVFVYVPGKAIGHAAALVDLGDGHDGYGDPDDPRPQGANGGGSHGAGFLVDEAGNDTYAAYVEGVNGGGYKGSGFLLDGAGDDNYTAEWPDRILGGLGANGGAYGFISPGSGAIVDIAGNDTYRAGPLGTNGGAYGWSASGLVLDGTGDDRYNATYWGTNGGARNGATAGLLDFAGNDTYLAVDQGANGQATLGYLPGAVQVLPSHALLYDHEGTDQYEDDVGGTGTDKTVLPKGLIGAQIDRDAPDEPLSWGAPTG